MPGPWDNEGGKQSADGPPFGTETTYWLYSDFSVTLVSLLLIFNIKTTWCRLRWLWSVSSIHSLMLSNAASPPHYCNPFPRTKNQRHAFFSSRWGWKL